MTLPINSRSLLLSLLVSTGGVVLAVFLQAPLLYRHGLTWRIPSRPPNIQRITFANGGTQTLLLAKSTINIHKIFAELVLLREANSPISPHKLRLNINPWISTCAEETSLGFIAAITGELYSLDLRQSDPQPHLIGKHQAASPAFLDCTTTASLLIVGDSATLSVWDTSTGTCLWQRNERATIAAAFLPNSERFFCCNCDEQMAELDARTGAMLKTWNSHCAAPFYLTFAKTARRFAAINQEDCKVGLSEPAWG